MIDTLGSTTCNRITLAPNFNASASACGRIDSARGEPSSGTKIV